MTETDRDDEQVPAQRVAVLSLHTSPLAQPGGGDAGGMNVYVRELVASLAHNGADASVYVRRWSDDLPDEVDVEPGVRVVHIDAGDAGPGQRTTRRCRRRVQRWCRGRHRSSWRCRHRAR